MKMLMKIAMSLSLGLSLAAIPAQGIAALQQGAKAPDFTLNAAQGGKPFSLSLKQTLRNGPVVLYFFPAAFTPDCTMEAHLFAGANGTILLSYTDRSPQAHIEKTMAAVHAWTATPGTIDQG